MSNNKEIYYCYSELTIIKIIVYAYDIFDIDEQEAILLEEDEEDDE